MVERKQPRRRRLFLDAPTFVLGVANPNGAAAAVLALCERGAFQAVTARPILWEVRHALQSAGKVALGRFYRVAASLALELAPMGSRRRGALAAARRARCGHFITLRPDPRGGNGDRSGSPLVSSPRDFLDSLLAEREVRRRATALPAAQPPRQLPPTAPSVQPVAQTPPAAVAAPQARVDVSAPEAPAGAAVVLAEQVRGLDARLQGLRRERRLYQRSGFNVLLLDDQIVPLERERLELVELLRDLGVEMAERPAAQGWRQRLGASLRRAFGR